MIKTWLPKNRYKKTRYICVLCRKTKINAWVCLEICLIVERTHKMNIIEKNIKDLKPYEKNPRLNDDAVKYVAESISQFGFRVPIVIDKDNNIVCGHTRWKACKKLKIDTVPCVVADDLTEEQIRAYRLADNKVGEKAEWDLALLDTELAEIETIDMTLLGFDDKEEETPQEVVEDDFDEEPPAEPKSKYGDLYQLGRHRLMCGDSTKVDDVEKLMNGNKADLLLTDPPYGVSIVKTGKIGGDKPFGRVEQFGDRVTSFKGTTHGKYDKAIVKATEYAQIIGDESTETAEKSFEVSKQFSNIQVVFGGNYFTDFLPASRCWFVWDKGMPDGTPFAQCELAWVSKDGNAKLFKRLWSGLCREGDRKTEGVKRIHPTQKPVSLCCDIIKQFDCESVLDLFGGSGSTLIACEQLEKKCYMMELSPQWVDVIINRWEQFTGQKAVKLNAD